MLRLLALAALMLLLLARMPFAGAHMGLARDLFVAFRIVHGLEFPLHGPVLNDTLHLGPVWFYFLAALLALGRGWLGTLMLLGAFAALQVPPLFDVKSPPGPVTEPLPLMPAYAEAASGRFLCSGRPLALHGAYAVQLATDEAVAMRLACGRADVQLGGDAADREHWLGLSRDLLARAGVAPLARIGPLGLVRAEPVGGMRALAPPDRPVYPAPMPSAPAGGDRRLAFGMDASERLAVSNLAFGFAGRPAATLRLDGRPVAPLASDAFKTVYACSSCAEGGHADASLELAGGNAAAIDVVRFR